MDFVAIDFETANENNGSVCAVGLAYVENGKITSSELYLVKPVPNYFGWMQKHSITSDMVKDAPGFDTIWKIIAPKISGKQLVAHYYLIDKKMLREALKIYDIPVPDFEWFCSYQFSKKTVKGLLNYTLSTVCDYFGIPLEHHGAESKARGAALVMLELLKINKVTSLSELSKHLTPLKISQKSLYPTDFYKEHPLYEKYVFFIGTLSSFSQIDAIKKVVDVGGIKAKSLNKLTNYLVVGNEDFNNAEYQTIDYLKAKKRIKEGYDLEIISEDDFLEYLMCYPVSIFITPEMIAQNSKELEMKNEINEFCGKTVYFSKEFELKELQLAGNLGAASHNCWELNEEPQSDYFIITNKEFDNLIAGEKSESVLRVEKAINQRELGGSPLKINCITEDAFHQYLDKRDKRVKEINSNRVKLNFEIF
ncbi:MAG: hypothetical protein LBG80_14170 [Bacteroidales bacterium]|jgi:DNA polymerase-3 subunit epsilon|nr:hypothetical protein [Bacteroidales bacterium]